MNTKHTEHTDTIHSNTISIPGKSGGTLSADQSANITDSNTTSEKIIRARLHESEELNASLEILLEQRTSKLLEIVTTNGKFLSIIAHDLRSPFSSILGILELLKLSLKEFNKDEIEEYVNIVYNSANNTLILLDNLLEWAVSQNIEKTFKPVKINLCELLREEIENLKTIAEQKQIMLSHTIEPGLNATADLQMVKTILRNLINNAIKYTNTDGKIVVTALENKQFVEISVNDTGIGISPEDRKKLFKIEAFHSTPGTNNEQGKGLGLMLCKEFVELHGGDIKIESEPGKGSSFAFTLPHYI
jgi:two-component system, sensor histidine kinase and response regulator